MRNTRRDHQPGVARPAGIVTFDDKAHDLARHPRAFIDEEHLDVALDEEHRVPLFTIIRTERVVLRFLDKKPPKPRGGLDALRDKRRMDVKTFAGAGKHPRSRPLFWPKPDRSERAVVLPRKLSKEAAVPLRINATREKFDPGNPRIAHLFATGSDELSCFHSRSGETFREGRRRVVALRELRSRSGLKGVPLVGHGADLSREFFAEAKPIFARKTRSSWQPLDTSEAACQLAHRSMRLLLINYEYPPLGGGAGQATASLAAEFAELGHEVVVLTSAFRDLPREESPRSGVQIYRVPVWRRRADRCTPLEMLTFCAAAAWKGWRLTGGRPFTASIAFFGIPSGPVAWLLRTLRGVPFITSLRGGDVPGFQPYQLRLHHWLLRPAIRAIWRRSHAVVANSTGLQALALRTAPELPIAVIPNGVDSGRFSPAPPDPTPPRSPLRLLFVGRLSFQKGVDTLLRALARIGGSELRLMLVGDGPERASLEAQARAAGLAGQVRFSGWQERAALPEIYRAADCFVFPSRDEGMPNALLEAMATGLPLIASRIAGNEELVLPGVNGLLVPADDVEALADALRKLLADPSARAEMGRASRRRALAEYGWRSSAQAYLALLESLSSGVVSQSSAAPEASLAER